MSGIEFLLDTNVVIGWLKGAPETDALKEELGFELATGAVSQITEMELLSFPKLQLAEEKQIVEFLRACRVLPISAEIARDAIALRRRTGIRLPDAIIGATARVHGLKLVTLDQRLGRALQEAID